MAEWRLFPEGTVPECATPEWYAGRDAAPHLEQAGHRERLLLTAEMCREARLEGGRTLVDLGAGDGGLLSLLARDFDELRGYDLQASNVAAAQRRGVNVTRWDVVNHWWPSADVAVVTEFLEHLLDPHGFLARLAARPIDYLVASSPYTEDLHNHYEYHLWAWDEAGYQKMLEDAGWRVTKTGRAWISQVVLCER